MADEGWPIFAEWRARKTLPQYGGNNIPDAHLDKFNRETDEWLRQVGSQSVAVPDKPKNLPTAITNFLEGFE